MLSIIGIATIIIIVAMLLRGKVIPIIPLVVIPIIAAFIAGFGIYDIGEFFDEGFQGYQCRHYVYLCNFIFWYYAECRII